jgi:predicted nucleic acid-binding Zn ribbon protein
MDPYYQPHISKYTKKAKYHYVCPVCGTELFKDTEIASCEACGCDELNSISDMREIRIPIVLAVCLAAIAVGLALVFF